MNEKIPDDFYIPEYNPKKYSKAYRVVKTISVTMLLLAFILGISVALYGYLDDNAFVWNVRGVPTKDYWAVWLNIILAAIVPALLSLFTFVLSQRLKQANAVFSESDEQKRLEAHLTFQKQADEAARIFRAHAAAQVGSHTKRK